MSDEPKKEVYIHEHYSIPPNISDNTWLEVEKAKAEIEKEKLRVQEELEKRRLDIQERLLKLAENLAPIYEEYSKFKHLSLIIPAYAVILSIAGLATYLAVIGKISGETVAFLLGILAGYAISVVSEKR